MTDAPLGLVLYGAGRDNFAALSDRDRVLAFQSLPSQGLAQALPTIVRDLLNQADPRGVDFVAVVTGPGSFTGLRATVAMASGLGTGADIAVKGVSLRDAMLETAEADDATVLLVNARRGYVFKVAADNRIELLKISDASDFDKVTGNAVYGTDAAAELKAHYGEKGVADPTPQAIIRVAERMSATEFPMPLYGEGARISQPKKRPKQLTGRSDK